MQYPTRRRLLGIGAGMAATGLFVPIVSRAQAWPFCRLTPRRRQH